MPILQSHTNEVPLSDSPEGIYTNMRIVRRRPDDGLPTGGAPFAFDVEIQAFDWGLSWLTTSVECQNVLLVARNDDTDEIVASSLVQVDKSENCTGRTSLAFKEGFIPYNNTYIRFEIYPATMGMFGNQSNPEGVLAGKVDPIAISQSFDASKEEYEIQKIRLFNPAQRNKIAQTFGIQSNSTMLPVKAGMDKKKLALGGAALFLFSLTGYYIFRKAKNL